jgi:hypothetical protein
MGSVYTCIYNEAKLNGLQVSHIYRILGYHIGGYQELYLREYNVCLCCLVVKVPDYRFRGPGSIPGATRFFSEK